MHFLPLYVETHVSLWHITDFENPMVIALKLKKVSMRLSQSCRSKPGAAANQLIVLLGEATYGWIPLLSCNTES